MLYLLPLSYLNNFKCDKGLTYVWLINLLNLLYINPIASSIAFVIMTRVIFEVMG